MMQRDNLHLHTRTPRPNSERYEAMLQRQQRDRFAERVRRVEEREFAQRLRRI